MEFIGHVEADGKVHGRYSEQTTGSRQWALRDAFATPMDSAGRATFARRIAQSWFPGARGDSLQTFNGLDLAEPAKISLAVQDGRALRRSGTNWILSNPVGSGSKFTDAADALEAEPVRRFPIDAAQVFGPEEDLVTFRLTLPAGWRPQLPPSVHASSVFGDYQATYTFVGGVLEVSRTMSGTRGVFPPDRIGELIAWFREVGADDAPFILIEPAPAP